MENSIEQTRNRIKDAIAQKQGLVVTHRSFGLSKTRVIMPLMLLAGHDDAERLMCYRYSDGTPTLVLLPIANLQIEGLVEWIDFEYQKLFTDWGAE